MAHVLIVEDDDDIRTTLADVVELAGHQVSVAANGREALDVLASDGPNIVFLDIMMPVMDGIEFLREASAEGLLDGLPVVVTSAFDPSRTASQLATRVMRKPYTIDAILEAVDEYCSEPGPGDGRG